MHVRTATAPALLLLAALMAACGGGRDDTDGGQQDAAVGDELAEALHLDDCEGSFAEGVSEDTIRIGSSFPQSGPYAAFAGISDGYRAYFDMINARGGVDGRRIELVALDDGYEPGRTATNVQRLIQQERVFALFNIVGTANTLAVWEGVEEECVPNLYVGTGSPLWGDPAHPWTIGSFPAYSVEVLGYLDYLRELDPDATLALLTQNDDFGRAYSQTVAEATADTDLAVVAEETYEPALTDVTSQVTSLAATGADAVILGTTGLACPNALNAIQSTTWDPVIFITGTCANPLLMGLAEPGAADGVNSGTFLKDPLDPQWQDDDAMREYLDGMAEHSDLPDDDINDVIRAYGWTMGALLVHTLVEAEELTRPAVMAEALRLDRVTVGLTLPESPFDTGPGDKYPSEVGRGIRYDEEVGHFDFVGPLSDYEDRTVEVTPDELLFEG
jgi:branched-chain amino acid transport system substrate-binding protein